MPNVHITEHSIFISLEWSMRWQNGLTNGVSRKNKSNVQLSYCDRIALLSSLFYYSKFNSCLYWYKQVFSSLPSQWADSASYLRGLYSLWSVIINLTISTWSSAMNKIWPFARYIFCDNTGLVRVTAIIAIYRTHLNSITIAIDLFWSLVCDLLSSHF